jgi:hypothetical protein
MDRTATALIAFARGPENLERRAAAMLLLAELTQMDEKTVAAVTDALGSETVLQEYALRYVEKLRPPGAVPALLRLLDAGDPSIRERTRRLLAGYGGSVVAPLARAAKTAGRSWLVGAVEVLATLATAPAVDALITIVAAHGDADVARTASEALHRRIHDLDASGRATLLRHVLAATGRADVEASPAARLVLVRAAAAIGAPGARRWLLGQTTRDDDDPYLRTEALAALATCVRQDKLLAKEVSALLAMLEEADAARLVRPALEMLQGHRFGADLQPALLRLRESPHVAVRSFALAKLGESESPVAVRALLGSLDDAEAVRRSAAGSLRKIPEARQALMKRFMTATDPSAAFTMAETLVGYGLPWRRPILDALWKRYQQAFAAEERIQGAFLHFLRTAAPDYVVEALRKESAKLLKAGRARDAVRLRQIVRELPIATDDDVYDLAVSLLKTRRRGFDAPFKRPDAALDLLVTLEDKRFPAAARLKRERALDKEELYAIGFALAEGTGSARRLGEEILSYLAAREPRTKIGKSARNKLALG